MLNVLNRIRKKITASIWAGIINNSLIGLYIFPFMLFVFRFQVTNLLFNQVILKQNVAEKNNVNKNFFF